MKGGSVDRISIWEGDNRYFAQINGAKEDQTIGSVYFHKRGEKPGQHTEEPKQKGVAYLKVESAVNVNIGTIEIEGGDGKDSNSITVGNLEFRSGEAGRAQSFNVNKVLLNENSTLRVHSDKAAQSDTAFHAETVVMAGNSGMAFGGGIIPNKVGADSQQIDTIWAGYVETADGLVADDVENAVTGIASTTSSNGAAVKLGTVNVGNSTFLTDKTASSIVGSSWGLGESTLAAVDGSDAITFNLNHEGAKASLGTVEGNVVANFSDEAMAAETAESFKIADLQNGTLTATAKNTGGDAQAQFEKLASHISVQSTPAEGGAAADVDYDMSLAASGINDGLNATWDADAGENGGVTNIRTGEENGVTHGFSQLAAVGYMQWRSAMNHMQYRLGEIRDQKGYNNGGWARIYNGKDEFGSQNVENKYYGVQAGYDHKIEGTNLLVGGAFSYTRGDSTFDLGDGDNYNYDFTLYGTWLADNGFYLDGTVKYGYLSNDVTFDHNNIAGAGTASYDTNAVSVSAEAGWRFPVTSYAYVEPQAEIMYGHIWGADYDFKDIRVTNEAVDMTVGRLGVQAGLLCPNKKGSAYFRASVLHDFQGDADVTFRQGSQRRTLNEELGDTWYELGIGANYNVTDSTYVYADFNYADGGEIESPWRWSVGVRFAW